MQKRKWLTHTVIVLLLLPVLALNIWFGISIHHLSDTRASLKKNYSEVNDILYGLLSVTVWRDNLQKIANDRISDFTFNEEQEKIIEEQLSKVLNTLITQVDSMIEQNDDGLKNKIRKAAVNTFIDWGELRKKVPTFSRTIYEEINKPENRDKLKKIASEKINDYAEMTRDSTADTLHVQKILASYHSSNVEDFNSIIAKKIDELQDKTYRLSFYMVASLVLFLLLWWPMLKVKASHKPLFILSVLMALIVLVVALTTPMIEIDARIKKLDYFLLGEHLHFNDQVIFYQSKSILDVVEILLQTKKVDSIFVGILILAFSILFPITKLLCTEIYLLGNEKIKSNKIVHFFAFKSTKWSMADVTVVAIFMSYIGFKGILDNQLQNLNVSTTSLTSIATNLTALQPGFILFVSFIVYGFVLSEILKQILKLKETIKIREKNL